MPAYTNIAQMLQQLQDPQMMGMMAQQLAQKGAPPALPQGAAPGPGMMPGPGVGPMPSSMQTAQAAAPVMAAPAATAPTPAAAGGGMGDSIMSGIGSGLVQQMMAGNQEQYMAPVGGQVVGNKPAVSPMALPPMMPQQPQMPTLAQLIAGRR